MDFIDFMFPEAAQASYLRKIAARNRRPALSPAPARGQSEEIASLRSDVSFLTLVLTAILKRLAETQTLSLADVQDLVDEVDGHQELRGSGLPA